VVPAELDPAVALNTSFMGDGALIHVAANSSIERPLNLVFLAAGTTPAAMFMRSLIVVEQDARVMVIESHEVAGASGYQVNAALELSVADGAHVDHV